MALNKIGREPWEESMSEWYNEPATLASWDEKLATALWLTTGACRSHRLHKKPVKMNA